MVNKVYMKDDMKFEGISMQEGKTSSTLKLLAFMIVTAVILGLLIFSAGSFFAGKNDTDDAPRITILPTSAREPTNVPEENITPSVTPRTTVKPSPTSVQKVTLSPTGKVNKTKLSVEVLNGSGTKGAAGKLSSVLTNAGYTVTSTGNADNFTYTGVTVNIKKSKASLLDTLKKDLSANNYLVTQSSTVMEESSTADAVVILGAEE